MKSEYTFEVVRELADGEISALVNDNYPALVAISSRYLPEIDLKNGFPCTPEYLDAIRTSWLLDEHEGKPPYTAVIRALWPALGQVLCSNLGLKWCLIKDSFGQAVSMVGADQEGGKMSVPPYSYVEKREHLQNAEVFIDLFSLLSAKLGLQAA